jgi:hypothetical protein
MAETDYAPLEPQEDEEDIISLASSDGFEAAIAASDWTAETIIAQLRKGSIFLDPSFQRREAWKVDRKSQFIESLIIGIPTPQIILAERKEKRGQYIVIDGKQRLLTLRQFAAGHNDATFAPFRLTGLKARPDLNGRSYDDISNDLLDEYTSAFENATIRTVIIKTWPGERFLYEVFLRINSGSVQLSPQELRQALHPGPFNDRLNNFAETSRLLRSVLGTDKPDFRMRDNELVIRFLAFHMFFQKYRGNLKGILDETTKILNRNWASIEVQVDNALFLLEQSIIVTSEIFGENDRFKRWNGQSFESRINRAVFDVMTYYFTDLGIRERAIQEKEQVVAAFQQLCEEEYDFIRAISETTKSIEAVNTRFGMWGAALGSVLGTQLTIPQIAQ